MFLRIIFAFFILFLIFSLVINYVLSSKKFTGDTSNLKSIYDGEKFLNIKNDSELVNDENKERPSFWSFIKQRRETPKWEMQELPNGESKPKERVDGKEIQVTFVNHATVLIQTEGLNILTDPIWSKRASPFSFIGPKRYMPVGVLFDDLPKIDIILLSHNHYDHMDIDTLKKISNRDEQIIYTHLGVSDYLKKRDINGSIDMDWWDKIDYSQEIEIHSVPAQHFSARAISDRNRTLWGGFVVRTQNGDIYFAGDTGYGPFVDQIKENYPEGFRFAMIPIGAYEPRSFMKEMHTSPEDAIMMHKKLGVETSMGIHHGTFNLSLESQFDPSQKIKSLLQEEGNEMVNFFPILNGDTLIIE